MGHTFIRHDIFHMQNNAIILYRAPSFIEFSQESLYDYYNCRMCSNVIKTWIPPCIG